MIWDKRAIVRYPSLCMFAGVAAGLLGIGGGMVKGPLLLEMGVLPQVASATSATMILFTASATTIQVTPVVVLIVTINLFNSLLFWVRCHLIMPSGMA